MKLSKKIVLTLSVLLFAGFLLSSGVVLAEDYGLGATAGAAGVPTSRNLQEIVGDVIGTILSFISVIFFVLMLYGGFLWMTARGESSQVDKARDTIFGAIIGIIIVLAAYAITQFVFSNLGPGGSGGGTTTTTVADTCAPKYGSAQLSCKAKTSCAKGQPAKAKVLEAAANYTGTGSDLIKYEPNQGDANVIAYFYGLCPGGVDTVCCP